MDLINLMNRVRKKLNKNLKDTFQNIFSKASKELNNLPGQVIKNFMKVSINIFQCTSPEVFILSGHLWNNNRVSNKIYHKISNKISPLLLNKIDLPLLKQYLPIIKRIGLRISCQIPLICNTVNLLKRPKLNLNPKRKKNIKMKSRTRRNQ